jgi:hypothetical protein
MVPGFPEQMQKGRLLQYQGLDQARSLMPFVSRSKSAVRNISPYDMPAKMLIAFPSETYVVTNPTKNGKSPPIARPAL